MQLRIAKNAGFCFGVEKAVKLAKENSGENVYTLGELIHNEHVNSQLNDLGVKLANSIDELPDKCKVIIRSHGVGSKVITRLKEKNCQIVDATCPYVDKIHKIVKKHYDDGDSIIIIGKSEHPEVIGINGWCENSAIIIENIDSIPQLENKNYCVVVQTTFDLNSYEQIVQKLKKIIKIVAIYVTICYTTKVRQEEALKLAQECDVMLVIGGKNSSNTKELYKICRSKCDRSYHIIDKRELSSIEIFNKDIIGVTAGASTPKELMMEVINTMVNQTEGMSEVKKEEVVEEITTATATNDSAQENVADEKNVSKADSEMTMADVMKKTKFSTLRPGKRMKGTVIRATEEGLYVNIGLGKDGFVKSDEVSVDDYNPDDYKSGDDIEAVIVANVSKEYISLSKKRADIIKKEEEETAEILKGSEFQLTIKEAVKGGLIGKMGSYTIFVPSSEIRIGYVNDLEQYKGKSLRLRAIPEKEKEDDKKRRKNPKRIVASQRVILAEEKDAKEEHFWAEMIPGNIVEGKVKRYAPFGVFVQVMGFDCLVHISDVSWTKIDDPSEILKINETYEFEILKADRERGRVSLSYKSLQKTPYEKAAEKFPVGTVVKGVVDRLATFGAFIKIDEGVDGLVHVSQISHEWIKDASQALKVGEEVEAKVIKFEDNKITLSIKELLPEPDSSEDKKDDEKESFKKRSKKREDKNKTNDEFREWVADEDSVTIGDLFAGLKDIVPGDDDKE